MKNLLIALSTVCSVIFLQIRYRILCDGVNAIKHYLGHLLYTIDECLIMLHAKDVLSYKELNRYRESLSTLTGRVLHPCNQYLLFVSQYDNINIGEF